MSRLYDALTEARRFHQAANGDAANGDAGNSVWEALGMNGSSVSRPVQPEGAQPLLPAPVSLGGTQATIALDRRARLIPHGVDPMVVEHYRMLRTKIIQEREQNPFRTLVVTSANPQEGKTVTSLNLALSFAMLPSFKVLIVDGDMRRGTLGAWLGVDGGQPGLSNLIDGSAQLNDVVLKSSELPIHFMVCGNSKVPDLHSSQLDTHFRALSRHFDLVLVDSPPANLVTDVQLFAASCDAVLIIARAFSTTRKAFEKAVQNLKPFRLIGAVLNAGAIQRSRRYSGYY